MSAITTPSAKLLTARQVAELLELSVRSISRLTRLKLLPRPVRIGRSVRWREDDILEYVRQLPQADVTN